MEKVNDRRNRFVQRKVKIYRYTLEVVYDGMSKREIKTIMLNEFKERSEFYLKKYCKNHGVDYVTCVNSEIIEINCKVPVEDFFELWKKLNEFEDENLDWSEIN